MPLTISGDTPNFSAATITTGTITTLNAPSGVLATQNGMTGIAKAWVNYNGNGQAVRNSFNVSSVTYNTTSDYTVNFTTAIASANPATVVSAGGMDTGSVVTFASLGSYNSASNYASTTSVRIYNSSSGSGIASPNPYYICCAVFSS